MNDINFVAMMPEVFLAFSALGFLLVGVLQGNRSTTVLCWSTCITFLITASMILRGIGFAETSLITMNAMIEIDQFTQLMKLIVLLGMFFSIALSVQYITEERIARFEYPVLVMLAGVGMMIMVSSNNMLSLYMGLELQSLSLYILAAFQRNSLRSAEAAAKYFILGAVSSGMLLFGISLVYGFSGSFDFTLIANSLSSLPAIHPGFTVGMVFILAGLAFKVSAVPFHMWTPDVYQGAPASVTAFFAIVPKVAAVALLMRLAYGPFGAASVQWTQIMYFMALASLVLGSFAGLVQQDIKRLLAYSSIANMGYVLMGVLVGSAQGAGAAILFLFIYVFMTAGIFALVVSMRKDGIAVYKISDLAGLSKTNPVIAYSIAALMFSMSGIPPLAGFFGKLFIFQAVVAQGFYVLATLGILTSVVSAYYYLRVIKVMFFDEPEDKLDLNMRFESKAVLFISIVFVLTFIFYPSLYMTSAMSAATALF